MLRKWLEHPLTRGLDLDDPRTTELRRRILEEKPFLRQIYVEWYDALASALPNGPGLVLELGSGAGFLDRVIPGLITSEILVCSGVRLVLDALDLPFGAETLRGIVMTNVLHHLRDPRRLFSQARHCVRPGGVVVMIEPWVNAWSTFVYTRLHHEPFCSDATDWGFPSAGPLSGANGALPWILFERDRSRFEQEFPEWRIEVVAPLMPFRYLVSGGVSFRSFMPGWSSPAWRSLEGLLRVGAPRLGMFARIVLRRR
jgi:SAM-dependent methyltransferase